MKSFSLILINSDVHSLGFCLFFSYCACKKNVKRLIRFILAYKLAHFRALLDRTLYAKCGGKKILFCVFCVKNKNVQFSAGGEDALGNIS